MLPIGRPYDPFSDVREIAVLRGGGLGDLLFALPAIDALAATYPAARITLLGTPLARTLLTGRPGPVAAVETLPFVPGVRDGDPAREPEEPEDAESFVARLHGRFDLAVQAHGGGRNANPFLLRLGARHSIGTATPDAVTPERWVRYEYYQHEILRWLEVVGLAGAAPTGLDPVVVVDPDGVRAARARVRAEGRRLVVVHPGATDPRRRWPEERFAEVVAARTSLGDVVVLVGDASDRRAAALIADLASRASRGPGRVVDLAGAVPLSELPELLAAADLVVADDSGPRHLAVAVGTPTVGVFWFGNVVNAGPFDRARHRVLMGFVTRCPVCGVDVTQVGWTAPRCPHDPSFVAEVGATAVLDQMDDLLATVGADGGVTASSAPRTA